MTGGTQRTKSEKPIETISGVSAKDPLKIKLVTEWIPITPKSVKVRKLYVSWRRYGLVFIYWYRADKDPVYIGSSLIGSIWS